ncbi:capsular polysaccharide biosynthesis protein [Wohlfahrtiimonas larvae]|uniref:Capsular polysaccharide biosynthesis protein n=1 Tax=Wohlfahrtiimonas larvae TaxID=1157986 RepID=A0ABP9MM36_9GAMM|nr:capsular polysaccharide biosynthesis protein [Wohlfahrtiimonas larvae]
MAQHLHYTGFKLWWQRDRWLPFLHDLNNTNANYYIGWGYKKSGLRALKKTKHASAFLLEDGFLRSVGLGIDGYPPLSLVVDNLGIYYDYSKPSRLEALIMDVDSLQPLLTDASRAIELIVQHHLSKYNHISTSWPVHLMVDDTRQNVLIIDQTAGDMALKYGGVTADTFVEMVNAAKAENPDAILWIKIHPDVLTGKKHGHLTEYLTDDNVRVLSENINPITLLEKMDKVYTATSQMGFEACMMKKDVVVFGVPWYAGWGLTDDRHVDVARLKADGRRRAASLEEVFVASYLQYCRYLNPYTNERGDIFDVIHYLIDMQRRTELLSGEIWCIGLSWWKRKIMQPFLTTHNNKVRFFKSLAQVQKAYQRQSIKIMMWGQKYPEIPLWAKEKSLPILRVEDGFIRSVGLGSNLIAPLSLVVDDLGIYFDAQMPSRLENILQTHEFNQHEITQADVLIKALVEKNIGKYNVGNGGLDLPSPIPKQLILIPGQVEDDASIRYGSAHIKSNLDLIKAVRKENPEAYLIYKPHPDVVSGNRIGKTKDEDALQYVDQIITKANILDCIEQVDEVHMMTSLSGFEALLRGKKVTCYGLPFYAGWGLTIDKVKTERRTRTLSLQALVAGAMLLYPTYIDPKSKQVIDAMQALKILDDQRKVKQQSISSNWFNRKGNQLKALWLALK